MSEVNKINLNDTLFDIEDTIARENITTMQANIANDLDACSLVAEEDKSIAGAYAVQQLNRSLGGTQFQVTDGQIQWKETGADTWNFFNGNLKLISQNTSTKTSASGTTLTAQVTYTHTCEKSGGAVIVFFGSCESPNNMATTESVTVNGVSQTRSLQFTQYGSAVVDLFLVEKCNVGDVIDLSFQTSRGNSSYMYASYALYA